MFEQSFVAGPARARTGWSMLASTLTQAGLLGIGILIPLANPELLPRTLTGWDFRIAPPPGRPAPPPVAPEAAPRPRAKAAPSQLRAGVLLRPIRIPDRPAIIIDEEQLLAQGPAGPSAPGLIGDSGVPHGTSPNVGLAPPPPPAQNIAKPAEASAKEPIRLRVGGDVQQGRLIHEVRPVYPPLAVQTRVEGTVTFTAVINTQGRIINLQVVGGAHPMLVPAATEAVRQWRYRPTLLNGDPVEVVTVIEVHFRLNR